MEPKADSINRLGLGTVQFGLDYGISNPQGKTPPEEAAKILELAWREGIRVLDTAALYGESEKALGTIIRNECDFRIVTKTESFKKTALTSADGNRLKELFYTSLGKLRRDNLYGLLLHHADDLLTPGSEFLHQALQELKEKGLVRKIGVSVYSGEQIDRILEKFEIDLVQLPLNILDQRLIKRGHLRKLKEKGVEIHARSTFLQGALLMNPEELPSHFDSVREHLRQFQVYCRQIEKKPLAVCLNFVLAQREIDHVILGICRREHLEEILASLKSIVPGQDYGRWAWTEEKILNPAQWRIAAHEPQSRD